jgi:hypothetical protein
VKDHYTIFKLHYYQSGETDKSFLCKDKQSNVVDFINPLKDFEETQLTFDTLINAFKFLCKLYPHKKLYLDKLQIDFDCPTASGEQYRILSLKNYDLNDEDLVEYDVSLDDFCYIQFNYGDNE